MAGGGRTPRMAWTYADWITQTAKADRVTRLRLHIQEVSGQIEAGMTHTGRTFDPEPLRQYLSTLFEQLNRLDPTGDGSVAASARATAGLTRARPA